MRKATKGALAAAAAATLMVGGAGSVAYWSDSGTIDGATIDSGHLTLSPVDCDPGAGTTPVWTIDGGTVFDPATDTIVPGDTLTEVCTTTLSLEGEHIGATLALDPAGFDAVTGLSGELVPAAAFTVDGDAYAPITDPGDHTIEVTVSVDFDGASATNGSQELAAALKDLTITATQTHNP